MDLMLEGHFIETLLCFGPQVERKIEQILSQVDQIGGDGALNKEVSQTYFQRWQIVARNWCTGFSQSHGYFHHTFTPRSANILLILWMRKRFSTR